MAKQFGFVILHYMAYDMTVECIEYIQKLPAENTPVIVVVDNASPNGSGKKLFEKYKDNTNIDILLNHQNLGFAQGNNLGYLFLKANYDCDFIIVMNNDVLIEQNDFYERIEENYHKSDFAVLGPDIFSPKLNESQSPTYRNEIENLKGRNIKDVQKIYENYHKFNSHVRYYRVRYYISSIARKIFPRKVKINNKNQTNLFSNCDYENVVLHGACYIFSKNYISKRKLCFNPNTFLYFEEDILHYECIKEKLKMVYTPSIMVKHLEDVSTDSIYQTSFKKTVFKNRNLETSLKVFLELSKDN